MEGSTRKEEACPQLLDLIPRDTEWLRSRNDNNIDDQSHVGSSSSKRELELSLALGPPGHERDWFPKIDINLKEDDSLLSLGYRSSATTQKTTSFLKAEKNPTSSAPANTAVPNNTSQKRTAPSPVVGWPPIRSFRKNLSGNGSSSKPPPTQADQSQSYNNHKAAVESGRKKGLLVKINMDGVLIGRKVDLGLNDDYLKLSSAVDLLFRGLLAAQRDSSGCGTLKKPEEEKAITGLLDGSGEYTLVYEDNEGDRMLVGDVPWNMFVSTVKRLRVLKSSELSALSLINGKQDQ